MAINYKFPNPQQGVKPAQQVDGKSVDYQKFYDAQHAFARKNGGKGTKGVSGSEILDYQDPECHKL